MTVVREENIRLRITALSELDSVEKQLSELIALTKQQQEITQQAALSARTSALRQEEAIEGVTKALKEQQSAAKKAGDEAADGAKKAGSEFDSLGKQVRNFTTLLAGAFALGEIKQFGLDIIEAKTQIDAFKISLDVMLGSKVQSAKLYAELTDLAKKTPFTLTEIQDQATKLLAYNVSVGELIPTITALGNISAAVGKEKLPQLTLAYGQVANAGKLMLTELRQFNEAGVPLIQLIADAYGKTRKEVQAMADDHEISFEMVRSAIMKASEEGGKYANLMEKISTTVGGQVSNLLDAFVMAKARIGDFFEDGIQKGTQTLKGLITALAGSDEAIKRTLYSIGSAATAILTLNSATKVAATLQAAWVVAMEAGKLAIGTYNITLIAIKGTAEGLTEAQIASAAAARGTWAAFASNPLGLIITAIGLATSAYLAFKAANEEVRDSIGEQEVALNKEKSTIEGLTNIALHAAEGTKKRRDAIQTLIADYPEYFKGLDTEKTSNTDLVRILGNVNRGYEQRIALARETYKSEKLAGEQRKLLEEQDEIFSRMTPEMQNKYGGDLQAAFDDFLNSKASYDKIFKDTEASGIFGDRFISQEDVNRVAYRLRTIQGEMADHEIRIQQIKTLGKDADLKTEEARYVSVMNLLKGANKSTEAEEKLHEENVAKIKGEAKTAELSTIDDHDKKKKEKAKLSAAEVSAILKEQAEVSLKDKLASLDAQEKAEREAANKSAKNAAEATKAILAIRAEYDKKREEAIYNDVQATAALVQADTESLKDRLAGEQEYVGKRTKSFKEIAEAAKEAEKQAQDARKETAKVNQEAAETEKKIRKETLDLINTVLEMEGTVVGKIGQGFLTVMANINLLSGKAVEGSQQRVKAAEYESSMIQAMYDQGLGKTMADVENAKKKVAEAKKENAGTQLEAVSAVIGVMGTVYQVLSAIADAFNNRMAEVNKAIAEGMGKARQAYSEFYSTVEQMSRDYHQQDMATFTGTFEQKEQKINEYYAKEKEYALGRDRIDATLAFYQQQAQILANAKGDAKKMIEGMIQLRADQAAREAQIVINQAELEKQHAKDVLDNKIAALDAEFQKFKESKEAEIDEAKKAADKKIELIEWQRDTQLASLQKELDTAKDIYDRQVQAARDAYDKAVDALRTAQEKDRAELQKTYDLKQQLLEQGTNDEIEKIGILDGARNEAVARYEIAETNKLIATRNRILATLTDEGEKARVTEEFDRRIKAVHDEVEQAKVDKTLGTKLATIQLRNEEKDESIRLKDEEKTKRLELDDQYQTKFKEQADERDRKLKELKDAQVVRETELKTEIETIKTNSKNAISKIENDLTLEINRLKDQITQKENETTQERKRLNFEYKNAVLQANAQIFAANKELLIAQLKAQIAVLDSQKSWTGIGNGKINDAINQIQSSIQQLGGIVFTGQADVAEYLDAYDQNQFGNPKKPISANGYGEINFPVFDAAGNPITLSYKEDLTPHTVYTADGREVIVIQASGKNSRTGEQLFFKGTEFVEGLGLPDGRDTVPARLTKGERIMTVDQNKQLAGISNEQVVQRIKAFDLFAAKYPQYATMMGHSGGESSASSFARLRLPDSMMRQQTTNVNVDLSALQSSLNRMESAFKNQKQLAVNIDKGGFSTALLSAQGKSEYVMNQLTQ